MRPATRTSISNWRADSVTYGLAVFPPTDITLVDVKPDAMADSEEYFHTESTINDPQISETVRDNIEGPQNGSQERVAAECAANSRLRLSNLSLESKFI
jgi:hypothetical protein